MVSAMTTATTTSFTSSHHFEHTTSTTATASTSSHLTSSTRKRKRPEPSSLPPLPAPLTIHPHLTHPISPFDPPPPRIVPTAYLPRQYFPLQWLSGQAPRLFHTTTFDALDSGELVMVAKVDGERTLYAVERFGVPGEGMFSLVKLGSWVKLGDVRRYGGEVKKAGLGKAKVDRPVVHGVEWWKSCVLSMTPETESESEEGLDEWTLDLDVASEEPKAEMPTPPESESPVESAVEQILVQTRRQYYETLYLAKTPIAYFAKSTLARARVFFSEGSGSTQTAKLGELVEFLEGMLQPLERTDDKYKSKLVQIAMQDEDEQPATQAVELREAGFIKAWSRMTFGENAIAKLEQRSFKGKLDELKTRETELQIILLLEVLALKKDLGVYKEPTEKELKEMKKKEKKAKENKTKKGKVEKQGAMDMDVLLDLLVDRLCIWRSLSSSLSGLGDMLGDEANTKKDPNNDALKLFYLDVVMPFYASRLPEKCAMLCKKCGGMTSSTTDDILPTPHNPRKRKPLSRSLTAPMLSVSTANLASCITSEKASQTHLKVGPLHRAGGLDTKKLAKREVKISTVSKQKEEGKKDKDAKAKDKDATLSEQLQSAINSIAKPNRLFVAGETMADRESRLGFVGRGTSVRKTTKPTRIPPSPDPRKHPKIQVTATPKKKKTLFRSPRKHASAHSQPPLSFMPSSPLRIPPTPSNAHSQPVLGHSLDQIPESSPFQPSHSNNLFANSPYLPPPTTNNPILASPTPASRPHSRSASQNFNSAALFTNNELETVFATPEKPRPTLSKSFTTPNRTGNGLLFPPRASAGLAASPLLSQLSENNDDSILETPARLPLTRNNDSVLGTPGQFPPSTPSMRPFGRAKTFHSFSSHSHSRNSSTSFSQKLSRGLEIADSDAEESDVVDFDDEDDGGIIGETPRKKTRVDVEDGMLRTPPRLRRLSFGGERETQRGDSSGGRGPLREMESF